MLVNFDLLFMKMNGVFSHLVVTLLAYTRCFRDTKNVYAPTNKRWKFASGRIRTSLLAFFYFNENIQFTEMFDKVHI